MSNSYLAEYRFQRREHDRMFRRISQPDRASRLPLVALIIAAVVMAIAGMT